MKKLIHRVAFALMLLPLLTGTSFAQGKTATIDLRKVFENYWKTKQAQSDVKDREASMLKDLKSFEDDLNKANEEYQKLLASASDQALSAEERDKRKASAEAKLKEMNSIKQSALEYRRSAEVTLEELMNRKRDAIIKDIRAVIDSKAKASNYTVVLDISAEGLSKTPAVLYSSGENDITDAVLTQMNSTAPTELPKLSGSKDEKKDEKK